MILYLIFTSLVAIGVVDVILQNLAIRILTRKDQIFPEADFLIGEKEDTSREVTSITPSASTVFSPPISILKPLKGLDDDLFDNLTSFCKQAYPDYEIIFALEEKGDPALKLAEEMKKRYPQKKISVVVKKRDYALNPKVDNLIAAYEASQFPYVLISDSDVRVAGDYLQEIIKPMEDQKVGLVSNLIRGIGDRTFGALLENLHLNSFVIGHVAILNGFFKMPTVVGKSMLMRKKAFEEIGAFEQVRNVLAEDYVIGDLMDKNGRRVVTLGYVINAVNHYRTLKQFIKRHVRWGKLRRKLAGIGYVSEIVSNAVFIACIALIVLGPTTGAISLAAAALAVKIVGDYTLGKRIKAAHPFFHYLLSPIKDIIIGFLWFVPFFSRNVMWRRHRYKISKGTRLIPIPDKKAR
jgi:ceramide glucosyltransferase